MIFFFMYTIFLDDENMQYRETVDPNEEVMAEIVREESSCV